MADKTPFSFQEFGASFKGFLDQVASQAPSQEPHFARLLREHFQADPGSLQIVTEEFEVSERPNVHLAIQQYVEGAGRSATLVGIAAQHAAYRPLSLADLVAPAGSGFMGGSDMSEGPVQYVNVSLDENRTLACVQCGLYLIAEGDRRLCALLRGPSEMGFPRQIRIEVMAAERTEAESLLGDVRTAMRRRNVYRGHVVSLSVDRFDGLQVNFHQLPTIERDHIILPQGVLEKIERETIRFSSHRERLLAAGRHLKRGLLLYGPPGTGKTLSAMYLAGQMKDRTVLLLTGRGLGLIEHSCVMARMLQPAMLVLEDVDLVAEERTRGDASCSSILFELLNQMDGLADDADIVFLLTTNRPDLLEPALASRPGRVDLAVEVPLPDAGCRRRLFELYGRGLQMQVDDLDAFVRRSEGVSAAFIRELLRKAALFAADESGDLIVRDRHLEEGLRELAYEGGALTRRLLGVAEGSAIEVFD